MSSSLSAAAGSSTFWQLAKTVTRSVGPELVCLSVCDREKKDLRTIEEGGRAERNRISLFPRSTEAAGPFFPSVTRSSTVPRETLGINGSNWSRKVYNIETGTVFDVVHAFRHATSRELTRVESFERGKKSKVSASRRRERKRNYLLLHVALHCMRGIMSA